MNSTETVNMSSVVRRCSKLLAMAEDGRGNASEAFAAGSQARNIMAKFSITRREIDSYRAEARIFTPAASSSDDAAKARADEFKRASQAFAAQFYAANAARVKRDAEARLKRDSEAFAAQRLRAAEAEAEAAVFAARSAAATAGRDRRAAFAARSSAPRAARAARPASAPAGTGAKGIRSTVSVEGGSLSGSRSFSSLRAAFEALSLPMGQHIKFRAQLKAMGKMNFNGFSFTNHVC